MDIQIEIYVFIRCHCNVVKKQFIINTVLFSFQVPK
jgi:hypothetical protein